MVADSPSVGGKFVRAGNAGRGIVTGILVGALAGAVFLGALYLPRLGTPKIFLRYSNPNYNGHLDPLNYIGPVGAGVVFSALLSAFVEVVIVGRLGGMSRLHAGLLAGACYLVALGGVGSFAWFAPAKLVGAPPNLIGLDMASPFALLIWVLVACGVHAARRPTQQG